MAKEIMQPSECRALFERRTDMQDFYQNRTRLLRKAAQTVRSMNSILDKTRGEGIAYHTGGQVDLHLGVQFQMGAAKVQHSLLSDLNIITDRDLGDETGGGMNGK